MCLIFKRTFRGRPVTVLSVLQNGEYKVVDIGGHPPEAFPKMFAQRAEEYSNQTMGVRQRRSAPPTLTRASDFDDKVANSTLVTFDLSKFDNLSF